VSVSIPPNLRRFTVKRLGAEGEAWLEELPHLVGEFERRWTIRVGHPFDPGGVVGFVAPATMADGTPAVFKISIRDRETAHEAMALRLHNGRGTVSVLASDEQQAALLLELCIPGTPLLDMPDEAAANSIAIALLRTMWQTRIPEVHPFDRAQDRASEWAAAIPREFAALSKPFETRLADQSVSMFGALGRTQSPEVLLHQDFHHGNILAAQRQPWLVIDPKPLVGDPAFDTGSLLRDRPEALLSAASPRLQMARRLDQLVEETALDRDRMRAWALAQAVDLGLWSFSVGDRADGERTIACARLLAAV
jgi:streptomycin 6-kinase